MFLYLIICVFLSLFFTRNIRRYLPFYFFLSFFFFLINLFLVYFSCSLSVGSEFFFYKNFWIFLLFHFYFFLVIKECSHTLMCTSFGFYFFSPHTLLLTLFQYLFRVYKYHHHHHMQRHGRHDDDRTRINTVLNVVCAREGQASNFRKKNYTHTNSYTTNRHMIFFLRVRGDTTRHL